MRAYVAGKVHQFLFFKFTTWDNWHYNNREEALDKINYWKKEYNDRKLKTKYLIEDIS